MNAEEESYARREDVSPAKTECAEKRNGRPDPIAAPVPKGARLSVTTSGAACRPGAYPWRACCLSDVPASGVPVAVFVRASAVAARVSVRAAEAVAVVSGRPVAGAVAGVVVQRFPEPLSAAPEPAAGRLAGAAAAGFDPLSAFLRRQHRSAESSAAP